MEHIKGLDSELRTKLKGELEKLMVAKKFDLMRVWFNTFDSLEEKAHKCHLFGYLLMPDYFRGQGCDAHLQLISENLSDKNEYTAFPRGFAKTTINQLTTAFEAAIGCEEFIVMIEKNFTEASEVLRGVRDVFTKPLTIKIFGKLIGHDKSGEAADNMSDARGDMFINGVRLRGVGFNKTIRGLKSGAWRPTKIYVDDVEEDEHIGNPEQRKKYLDNYLKGIIPALDRDGSIKVRGTILHFDSLLYNLIQQHNGVIKKAYNKFDPKNTLLWEKYWTLERLEEKKEEMRQEGFGVNAFYQEYLNEPISEDDKDFVWEDITKTYKPEDLARTELNRYATLDVADSTGEGRDYTGVIVEDIDKEGNWYNALTRKYRVDVLGLIDLIFELWDMPNMRVIGVEKKAFEDQIKPLLDSESVKRGKFPNVVELKHGGKRKIDRIKGALQPLYRQGKIFNKEEIDDDTKELYDQLYSIGGGRISSKHDDLVDAKAYIEQIAERPIGEAFKLRWNKSKQRGRIDPFKLFKRNN